MSARAWTKTFAIQARPVLKTFRPLNFYNIGGSSYLSNSARKAGGSLLEKQNVMPAGLAEAGHPQAFAQGAADFIKFKVRG